MIIKKGEKIESKGNGYTLVIPAYNNPQLQKFHQEAVAYAGDFQGRRRVGKLVEFVHNEIKYDEKTHKQFIFEREVSLIRSLKLRKGVCKEKAAILSMLLQMEGFPNEFRRGTLPTQDKRERHAWVKVNVDGEPFLADPEQLRFGKYDSVLRINDYSEDK
jgi:transglutaminase-like putative cysteine protease